MTRDTNDPRQSCLVHYFFPDVKLAEGVPAPLVFRQSRWEKPQITCPLSPRLQYPRWSRSVEDWATWNLKTPSFTPLQNKHKYDPRCDPRRRSIRPISYLCTEPCMYGYPAFKEAGTYSGPRKKPNIKLLTISHACITVIKSIEEMWWRGTFVTTLSRYTLITSGYPSRGA